MKWRQINIKEDRLNGLKLRVAQISANAPPVTIPNLLDHILEKDGIQLLTAQELIKAEKKMEVAAAE